MINYILTETVLTVIVDQDGLVSKQVHRSDRRWDAAIEALKANDRDQLLKVIDLKSALEDYTSMSGDLKIVDGKLVYKGDSLPESMYIVRRIIDMAVQNLPIKPLLMFLEKLMRNPSRRAVHELLGFLEYGDLPITGSGNFLAYKKVNQDYTDVYTGKIDNSVGQTVSMPRNQVDDRSDHTCSYGLHFASREYIKHFSGSHLMVLEISPEDVVSIPTDYNNTKGRCCRYRVAGELEMTPMEYNPESWKQPIVDEYDEEEYDFDDDDDDDDDDDYQWDDYR